MFCKNLINLRKLNGMTQEELAEKVGVTRQALAKWEAGETNPDIEKCRILASVFGVSIDELANYRKDENYGLEVPPKGRHFFGTVKVGENGQIVIPAKARQIFGITAGTQLAVLGDENSGLALIKVDDIMNLARIVGGVSG